MGCLKLLPIHNFKNKIKDGFVQNFTENLKRVIAMSLMRFQPDTLSSTHIVNFLTFMLLGHLKS